MRNIGTIIAAVILTLVLVLYMCTFQVRFTEVAIKKTWGKPEQAAITEPGLYPKWPAPIQRVVVYDKRTHVLEDRTEETRTVDGKAVLLTTFTLWRIADPVIFHTNFPDGVADGEKKLRTTVITHKHAVTGQHAFSEFVSTDPAERRIEAIEARIKEAVARDAMQEYGIEVVDFGIKKLGLPGSVTSAIFQSMRSREEARAGRYIAEGDATAARILAEARAREQRILAEARSKANEIETEAQRIVSEYYKAFDEHPELRVFLDQLRTIRDALRRRTTLILDTSESPWSLWTAAGRAQTIESQQQQAKGEPAGEPVEATAARTDRP